MKLLLVCGLVIVNSIYTLEKIHKKALQHAIWEDSLERFVNSLSGLPEIKRLNAYRNAIENNAQTITHSISQTLKEEFLILAARHGCVRVTEFLTQSNIYTHTPATEVAFYEALKKAHFRIAKLLLNKGLNINRFTRDIFDEDESIINEPEEKTLLHHAVYDSNEDNLPVIQWLLAHGADPNIPSKQGDYPLHDIVWDEFGAVELLCDYGADPNVRDSKGNTPLMSCIISGKSWDHEESRAIIPILAAGADVNAKNNTGRTALHLAVGEANPCTALILLHYGASKEIGDQKFLEHNQNIETYFNLPSERAELKMLFSSPILPPLPQIAIEAQEHIKKKKVKMR